MTLATGQILNSRYRIVTLLGQGGFGAVYRAWDMNMERPRALKENLDTSEVAQRQFKREAQMLGDLTHPNLPKVIDHFHIPGQGQYLVMEYVEGEDLQQVLERQGPLSEAQALPWILQVCDALSYLHSQNPPVIHRDIKPANIKITPQGRAMLVDFGIAKTAIPGQKTTAGARAVTPGYSPPEQYGRGATDAQSDVYALGATLYALLSGAQPPDSVDVVAKNAPPPPPVRQLNPAVSAQVSAALEHAMQVERTKRTADVAAFKAALLGKTVGGTQVILGPPVTSTAPLVPGGGAGSPPGPAGTGQPPALRRKALSVQSLRRLPLGWIILAGLAPWLCLAIVWGLSAFFITQSDRTATQTALAQAHTQTAQALVSPAPREITEVPATTEAPAATNTPLPPSPTPTETLTSTPAGLPLSLADERGVPMALIPAGEFQMGSESGDNDEKPVHTVYLDAFYMDIYEVTNALYEECVQAGVCTPPGSLTSQNRSGNYYGNPYYADYPVIWVNWEQARVFCEEWRGARLPTEAEWEKAARGGLQGKLYPWGDEEPVCQKGISNGAKFDDDAGCNETDTEPVGSYSANKYGLFDMAGNVWEWVWDWYGTYSSSYSSNPQGPDSGTYRVLRSGCWGNIPNLLRVASRYNPYPNLQNVYLGFRCGASAPPGP